MTMYLDPQLRPYFSAEKPLFGQLMDLKGECYRRLEGRATYRVRIGDKYYFIKQHRGVGWREIIKNCLQGRWPVLGAKNEWQALLRLKSLGILTPNVVGFGQRGINPAKLESFVLMEEVAPAVSLEHPIPLTWHEKQTIIKDVATLARRMHEAGINHRDFYICHFLRKDKELFLIDLHRAQIRKKTPKRWLIKDLAGLYFSSQVWDLTKRDYLRFLKLYRQKPLIDIFKHEITLWKKVKARGEQLYRKHQN